MLAPIVRDCKVSPPAAPLPLYVKGSVNGLFGTLVHQIVLRTLATRLAMAAGLLVFTEERVSSGDVDLIVFMREATRPGRGEAHLYELVPDQPRPYASRADQYLDDFPNPFKGLHVTNVARGRVLTYLRVASPGLFEPLLLRTPAIDVFVRFWPAATGSGLVKGVVGYDWGYHRRSDELTPSDVRLQSTSTGMTFGLRGGVGAGSGMPNVGPTRTVALPPAASAVAGAEVRIGSPGLIVAAATVAQEVAPLVLKLFTDLRPVTEPLRAAG
jgi:hypothetical protein